MAKRKKKKISPLAVKIGVTGLLALSLCFGCFKGIEYLLVQSDYFKVKTIVIDPSLQLINKRDLSPLKGKSIFKINLSTVQRKLSFKYPEVSQLKIMKRYPNQIHLVAKKRIPFMQTRFKSRLLTLDEKGVVLSITGKREKRLPLISGLTGVNQRIVRGLPLQGKQIHAALRILKVFQLSRDLTTYQITKMDVTNLSKINFTLSNKLRVIVDSGRTGKKMKMLGLILLQGKLNLKEIKYVDLRFKEPIVGKK